MPPAKTQQTDTEELAYLKQANTALKRELMSTRRLSTHHRVQQLIQHVQELEDVIISMKVLAPGMHPCSLASITEPISGTVLTMSAS